MAVFQNTLEIGRVGLKEVFRVEASNYPDAVTDMLGNRFTTTQTFERFKSIIGLGPAQQIDEGESVLVDDYAPLFTRNFTPLMFAKAVQFTPQTLYTIQYQKMKDVQPQLAQNFMLKRNKVAANIYNSGFTDTTLGMNSETLFSTSHANGSATGSNRPAVDIALGPLGVQRCRYEMAGQLSARQEVMPNDSAITILYPYQLAGTAYALENSQKQIGSNINDANFANVRFNYRQVPYLTSATAWFARYTNNSFHKLFMLEQMPYDVMKLSMTLNLMETWVAFETYVAGWADWHGTWGTTGA